MFSIIIMVLLMIIAGWLDARLNWPQDPNSPAEETLS